MRFMTGWTSEISSGQYVKLEVELGEDDLQRMLAEYAPGLLQHRVPSRLAFQLLENEATLYLAAERLTHTQAEFDLQGIERMKKRRQALLETLAKLAPADG